MADQMELSVLFSYRYWILSFMASYWFCSSSFASSSFLFACSTSFCLSLISDFSCSCLERSVFILAAAAVMLSFTSDWLSLIFAISLFFAFSFFLYASRFFSASVFAYTFGTAHAPAVSDPARTNTNTAAQILFFVFTCIFLCILCLQTYLPWECSHTFFYCGTKYIFFLLVFLTN